MPAIEAIVANTSRNAWLMGLEGEVGVIAPGKLDEISTIIKDGRVVDREAGGFRQLPDEPPRVDIRLATLTVRVLVGNRDRRFESVFLHQRVGRTPNFPRASCRPPISRAIRATSALLRRQRAFCACLKKLLAAREDVSLYVKPYRGPLMTLGNGLLPMFACLYGVDLVVYKLRYWEIVTQSIVAPSSRERGSDAGPRSFATLDCLAEARQDELRQTRQEHIGGWVAGGRVSPDRGVLKKPEARHGPSRANGLSQEKIKSERKKRANKADSVNWHHCFHLARGGCPGVFEALGELRG
jgi:hypothetical protein